MQETHRLEVDHKDLIHDVSYDFYGKRMATCSSDQTIKVWDLITTDTGEQKWELNDEWKAHDGSVLRVAWANPEYGQVIASCSVDRTVRIWEEQEHEKKRSGRRWAQKNSFLESRSSVYDIKFAPKHLGLKLATSSSEGIVRFYEAMDVMNLTRWNFTEEVEVVLGGKERDGSHCLSWCKSRFQPPMVVVGCGRDNSARIYRYTEAGTNRKWVEVLSLPPATSIIHDVSWAPNMGKSYHLIATASKDKLVRIFKLKEEGDKLKCENVFEFDDHRAEVWKVEWNITGTILASSGDDGKVRLWKANYIGEWSCIATLNSGDSLSDNFGS